MKLVVAEKTNAAENIAKELGVGTKKDKVYNTSVLTLQVEQKDAEGEQSEEKTEEQTDPSLALTGWRYCSNHIIYHAESAEA